MLKSDEEKEDRIRLCAHILLWNATNSRFTLSITTQRCSENEPQFTAKLSELQKGAVHFGCWIKTTRTSNWTNYALEQLLYL